MGAPDILAVSKCLSWSFIWRSLDKLQSLLSPGQKSPCLWRIPTRWFDSSIQFFHFDKVSCVFLSAVHFISWFYDLLQGRKEKSRLSAVFTEWSNRRAHHTTAWLKQQPTLSRFMLSLQQCHPTGQFVLDLRASEQVAERFSLFQLVGPKWEIVSKKYPLVKAKGYCIFNQELLSSYLIQIKLMRKVKIIVRYQ